jgi:hypothetical protein
MLSGLGVRPPRPEHAALFAVDEEATLDRYRYVAVLAGQPMDLPLHVSMKTMAGTLVAFERELSALMSGTGRPSMIRTLAEVVSRRLGYLDPYFSLVPGVVDAN